MTHARPASAYPFFDNAGLPIAMAHRGGARLAANHGIENSLAAFEAAVDLGYRYVETDVHASADGVLIAFHDHTLDRVTDRRGRVRDLPYSELARARIGGREPIPRLEDILSSWPQLRVNVDCKSSTAIGPLVDLINGERAWDRVCVASFSARRLHLLRARLGSRVATALSPLGVAALRLLPTERMRRAAAGHSAQAAQVPMSAGVLRIVTPDFVERAHRLGALVHVWTVDDPDDMAALLDLGVDGIITDRPDVLRGVCLQRGIWTAST